MAGSLSRRTLLGTVAVALLVGVPFLGKAFHIDDTFVLAISAQILRQPLRPFDMQINWQNDPVPAVEITKNPPLLSYYLAPLIALFGCCEVALHTAMLPFLVLLAIGTALLGKRFGAGPWWPMLFVMFSPAVVVSSNVMRDVPAAALLTLGMALFVIGTDDERRGLLALGAGLVGLATLTKYSSAGLIPLLALYPLLRRKWRYAAWALLPAAFLGAWCVQNWLSQGSPHVLLLLKQREAKTAGFGLAWPSRFYGGLAVAGATLFLLPALIVASVRRRVWIALPAMALAGLAAAYGLHAHFAPKAQPDWQYCLWATTGAALLFAGLGGGLLAAWQAFRKRHDASGDLVLLVAWAAALAVFSIVWAPFQAVRHFLPVLPPLAVVVMRLLGPPRRLVSIALGAMLAAQVGVACLVAAADCEHAGAYRAFARYGAERYAGAGQEVWFNGHWGWQHYALARGFKQISLHGAAPPPGAIVLEPKWVSRSSYPPGLKLVPVEERIYMARLPVRTMDSVNSYFYSVTKRRMPYYFTAERTPVQIGQVFRVEASGKPSRP